MDAPKGTEGQRQSQINEQLSCLGKRITLLHRATDELVGRLLDVMTEEKPGEVVAEKQDIQQLVPLAHQIRAIDGDLSSLEYKIRDILERLEL